MRRPDGLLDGAARALSTRLASGMTRRSFLGRMGGAVLAATGGAAVGGSGQAREERGVPLLRPHLDDRVVPEPARSPAHRQERLSAAAERRTSDRQSRPPGQLRGLGCGRLGQPPALGPDGEFLPRAPRTRLCEDWTNEHYKHWRRHAGRVVPLLRRPGAEARGLLLVQQEADQRRCVPDAATASMAGACSASFTTTRGSSASRCYRARGDRASRRCLGRLVALRPLHGRDLHSRRVREPLPSTARTRTLRARGSRRIGRCSARRSASLGASLGTGPALIAAAALAFLAALREAGSFACPSRSPAGRCRSAGDTSCRFLCGAPATGPASALAFSPSSRSPRSGSRAPRRSRSGNRPSRPAVSRSTEPGALSWPSGRGTESRTARPPSRDSSDAPPSSRVRTRSCSRSRSSSLPSHRLPAPLSPRLAAASTRPQTERRSRGPASTPGPSRCSWRRPPRTRRTR